MTHYYPPEVGAPQARLSELASLASARGHAVTVVTGFPNYPTGVIPPAYRGRSLMEERLDGVRVLRTWVYAARNRGFARRILNHLSFAVSSLWAARRAGPVDVIFVESPPLLIGLAALAYTRLKRAPFIFNVSDIWPQSAVELGA
ncbi:MAG TPA: glycosyltransferase, partial [Candidatus Dormibacteraeota bacterium]|nr:glycosyltransferase [Candidatus Dormibacteraeota bacterium]